MVKSRTVKRSRMPKRRKPLTSKRRKPRSSKRQPEKQRVKPKPRTRRLRKRGRMQKLRSLATKVDDSVAKLSGKTDPKTDRRAIGYELGDISRGVASKVSGKIQKKLLKQDYHKLLFDEINEIRRKSSNEPLPYNQKAKDVLGFFTPIECNFFTKCLQIGPNGGTENRKLSRDEKLHLMELAGAEMRDDYDIPKDKRYILFQDTLRFFLMISPRELKRY